MPPTATSSAAAIVSRSPSSTQYALEYRGNFLEDKFTATLGLRAPFFTRELNQYCYTPNGGNGSSGTIGPTGGTLCTSRAPTHDAANGNVIFPANPMTAGRAVHRAVQRDGEVRRPPAERRLLVPRPGTATSSTCRTPKACLRRAPTTCTRCAASPTTPNRAPDAGIGDDEVVSTWAGASTIRPTSPHWRSTRSTTRTASSRRSTPDLGFSVDRNVGDANIEGFDAQIGQRFGDALSLTRIGVVQRQRAARDLGRPSPAQSCRSTARSWSKRRSGPTPRAWTSTSPKNFHVGLQAKKVGDRFATDLNDEIAPGYTVVDLDLNYDFKLRGFEARRAAAQRDQPHSTRNTSATSARARAADRDGGGFYSIGVAAHGWSRRSASTSEPTFSEF